MSSEPGRTTETHTDTTNLVQHWETTFWRTDRSFDTPQLALSYISGVCYLYPGRKWRVVRQTTTTTVDESVVFSDTLDAVLNAR